MSDIHDQVTGIVAAMSMSRDGWSLACEMDRFRRNGKVIAIFNVGYGDTLYILACNDYWDDDQGDLIQGAMYIPGSHVRSSNVFIDTPLPLGKKVDGALYWSFEESDPWPVVDSKKSSVGRSMSDSSEPVVIPRVFADWIIEEMDASEATVLSPGEFKTIKFIVSANDRHYKVRIPGALGQVWVGLGIRLLDGGSLEELGLDSHGRLAYKVLDERSIPVVSKRLSNKSSSDDGIYRGLLAAKARGRLDWVEEKLIDHVRGYCRNTVLYNGATVELIFYASVESGMYPPFYSGGENAEAYRAICNIATDWNHWQYFNECSNEQAMTHVLRRDFTPADISSY